MSEQNLNRKFLRLKQNKLLDFRLEVLHQVLQYHNLNVRLPEQEELLDFLMLRQPILRILQLWLVVLLRQELVLNGEKHLREQVVLNLRHQSRDKDGIKHQLKVDLDRLLQEQEECLERHLLLVIWFKVLQADLVKHQLLKEVPQEQDGMNPLQRLPLLQWVNLWVLHLLLVVCIPLRIWQVLVRNRSWIWNKCKLTKWEIDLSPMKILIRCYQGLLMDMKLLNLLKIIILLEILLNSCFYNSKHLLQWLHLQLTQCQTSFQDHMR